MGARVCLHLLQAHDKKFKKVQEKRQTEASVPPVNSSQVSFPTTSLCTISGCFTCFPSKWKLKWGMVLDIAAGGLESLAQN